MHSLLTPVFSELPFFALFLLAIAFQPLRFFPSPLLHGNVELVTNFLLENFPRAGATAYLFTLLVYYSRSWVVRIGCYALGTVLFAVCLFLQCVFGKTLQPDIIMLVAETNPQESSEFLRSFLFSAGGIATLVCLVAYIAAIFILERRKAQMAAWWSGLRGRQVADAALCAFLCVGLVQFRFYGDVLASDNVDRMRGGTD